MFHTLLLIALVGMHELVVRFIHCTCTYLCLQRLKQARCPIVIVGSSLLQRPDGAALHKLVAQLAENTRAAKQCAPDWKVLNVLHRVSVRPHVMNTRMYMYILGGAAGAVCVF